MHWIFLSVSLICASAVELEGSEGWGVRTELRYELDMMCIFVFRTDVNGKKPALFYIYEGKLNTCIDKKQVHQQHFISSCGPCSWGGAVSSWIRNGSFSFREEATAFPAAFPVSHIGPTCKDILMKINNKRLLGVAEKDLKDWNQETQKEKLVRGGEGGLTETSPDWCAVLRTQP